MNFKSKTFLSKLMIPTLACLALILTSCTEPERPQLSKEERDRRGREAAEMLIGSLADAQSDVQWIAVENLVMIGEPALEPLLRAIKDPNPFIRRRAAEALGRLRDERAILPLINALSDPVSQVRMSSAFGLALLKDERAIEPLLVMVASDQSNVATMAAMSLIEITGENFGTDKDKWAQWYANKKATNKK